MDAPSTPHGKKSCQPYVAAPLSSAYYNQSSLNSSDLWLSKRLLKNMLFYFITMQMFNLLWTYIAGLLFSLSKENKTVRRLQASNHLTELSRISFWKVMIGIGLLSLCQNVFKGSDAKLAKLCATAFNVSKRLS